MSAEGDKPDWKRRVDEIATGKSAKDQIAPRLVEPEKVLPAIPSIGEVKDKAEGVLVRFKEKRITRKAAAEQLKILYEGQRELIKHQVNEAVRIGKASATQVAETYLFKLNSQHLEELDTLGLQNTGKRQEMLRKLADQTSQNLRQAEESDWPDSVKKRTIDGIFELHDQFFDKLNRELGER
ncbi:MAG: hypothetical protein ACREQF_05220 [Candidatus Binataceae bacterium]